MALYTRAETCADPRYGYVEVGAIYQRVQGTNVIETAEVIALSDDFYGVPHVRYQLTCHLGLNLLDREMRTLAVDSFLSTFSPIGEADLS